MKQQSKRIAVFGAGFGGLSAAYHLKKNGFSNYQVFEASEQVGGLARSFEWHGVTCDLAPHRLFSNDQEILSEMLDLVPCHSVQRNSRICLSNKWIADPVNAIELMMTLPKKKALEIAFSYLSAVIKRADTGNSFDSYVQAKFGNGLNEIFFQPYAEKLFGIPADKISASWGESKVRVSGVKDMLRRNTKLYFDKFYYPNENGYGAFVDHLYAETADKVSLATELCELSYEEGIYTAKFENAAGEVEQKEFDIVINTIPVSRLAKAMSYENNLHFRGAKLVYLLVNKPQLMSQQWVYFVDREYPINRMAEFKNFSPASSSNNVAENTVICAEVTDHQRYSDEELVAAVSDQLVSLDMLNSDDIIDHKIIPISHAYPVYDLAYEKEKQRLDTLFDAMPNIHFIGRQAQFMHQDIDEIYASAKTIVSGLLAE